MVKPTFAARFSKFLPAFPLVAVLSLFLMRVGLNGTGNIFLEDGTMSHRVIASTASPDGSITAHTYSAKREVMWDTAFCVVSVSKASTPNFGSIFLFGADCDPFIFTCRTNSLTPTVSWIDNTHLKISYVANPSVVCDESVEVGETLINIEQEIVTKSER